MNEFTNSVVPVLITVVSLAGILGCGWLAWHYRKTGQGEPNPETPQEAIAEGVHVWDGDLYELNNPLPRWFLGMFFIAVVFALIYLALYPGLGNYPGLLGWTSVKQYDEQTLELDERVEKVYAEFKGMSVEQLAHNERAMSIAHSLFLNNCAQCHGSDAGGSRGFPRLTDQDWLYGGTPEAIRTTITKGRHGIMPPQAAAVGDATNIRNVAAYVLSLSGARTDAVAAARGKPIFESVCAACHGVDGKGNQALGAPNLTDRTWLYGGSEADIIETITNGRQGVMPAHEGRLTPEQIELLVAYLLNRSGSVPKN